MNKEPIPIKLDNICFAYPGSGTNILDNLSFALSKGDRVGMIAPNGSGKTTLLYIIMGLLTPSAGAVTIFGERMTTEKEFAKGRRHIGLLFQDSDDQLFHPYVVDDVAFGPLNLGFSREAALETARDTLEILGIGDLERSITTRLSGGQKRLVALAAILSMKPEVLLLDEPTAGLDTDVKARIENILKRLNITLFAISHDFNFLNAVTDRIFSMQNGKVIADEKIQVHQHEHVHPLGNYPHTHT